MKKSDLAKALDTVQKSIIRTRMVLRDDPKANAQLYKFRYERALIQTMLQISDSQ